MYEGKKKKGISFLFFRDISKLLFLPSIFPYKEGKKPYRFPSSPLPLLYPQKEELFLSLCLSPASFFLAAAPKFHFAILYFSFFFLKGKKEGKFMTGVHS